MFHVAVFVFNFNVMARNIFNSVPLKKVKRNPFNLSFINAYSADFGFLYPVISQDAYAGEIYRVSLESFIRSKPLRAPAFTECDQSYHLFFVPYRLIYDDWTKFIVRGDDAVTNYDKPFTYLDDLYSVTPDFYSAGSLMDFLNFPTANSVDELSSWNSALAEQHDDEYDGSRTKIDMLPFNAYNLIYNEYYRDENLIPEVFIWSLSGSSNNQDAIADYAAELYEEGYSGSLCLPWILRKRAWRKDYFTSALPFAQKGTPISLMGVVNPVNGNNSVEVKFAPKSWSVGDSDDWFLSLKHDPEHTGSIWQLYADQISSPPNPSDVESYESHYHSARSYLSSLVRPALAYIQLPELQSTMMTISDVRVGLALQQWFELDSRTGSSRYFEYLLGHFGVRDGDSRLQRPEYIGGFTHAIQISEVEQNSETSANSPQGNLAGRGLGYAVNRPLTYRCPEPGFIMCISSLRPRAFYYQGMPRKYQRWDSFDYYDPLFDHIGEQAIKKSELFFDPSIPPYSDHDRDHGYTPYFSDRRTHLNEVHGSFRSDSKYWVSPRVVDANTNLDLNFIEIDGYSQGLYDMFSYIGSSPSSPHFDVYLKVHMSMISPMSKYAVPGL